MESIVIEGHKYNSIARAKPHKQKTARQLDSQQPRNHTMRFLVLAVALVCVASIGELVQARHSNLHEWAQFKRQHGKVYEDRAEEANRFALFLETKEKIAKHNANESHSYKLGLNHMADWTQEERSKLSGFRHDPVHHELRQEAAKDDPFLRALLDDATRLPEYVDWRKIPGRVTPVKNQGQCGSCWAFATTGVLEGQQLARNLTKDGKLVSLSEQDLVDCSDNDFGCDGGIMSLALTDVSKMGGIESEKDYPYVSPAHSECKFDKKKAVLTDSGSVDLPQYDEETLKTVVAKFGPVAVAIEATESMISYKEGVFDDTTCTDQLNHGVLVVGYGVDALHGNYWIIKNSWSKKWGENGYMKLKRGVRRCGISKIATIPTFKTQSS